MDNSPSSLERLQSMLNVPPSSRPPEWINPLEKIEQLLTCSVCLDRYKNPKLLPCQHTFCLEPCLDGLADQLRHIIKCPECRAEHSLPYDGVKGFQTNYSLVGFLEIHFQATEENATELEAYIRRYNLEKCKVCEEKAEVAQCTHCDKKICANCRSTHVELLKRDLNRLTNQVKRVGNRIVDSMEILSRNTENLKFSCNIAKDEIHEYVRYLSKELKKREDKLIAEIDAFEAGETRLATHARENLEMESANISEGCQKVENCLRGDSELTVEEMTKYKQLFSDSVERLRAVNVDADDVCNKKILFSFGPEPHLILQTIGHFGELQVSTSQYSHKLSSLDQSLTPRLAQINADTALAAHENRMKKRAAANWTATSGTGQSPQTPSNNGGGSSSYYALSSGAPQIRSTSPSYRTSHHTSSVYQPGAKSGGTGTTEDFGYSTSPTTKNTTQDGYSERIRRRQLMEDDAWKRLKSENDALLARKSPVPSSSSRYTENDGPSSSSGMNNKLVIPKVIRPKSAEPQELIHEGHHETSRASRNHGSASGSSNQLLSAPNNTSASHSSSSSALLPCPTNGNSNIGESPIPKRRIQRQETEDDDLNQRIDSIRRNFELKQRESKDLIDAFTKKSKELSQHLRSKTCELSALTNRNYDAAVDQEEEEVGASGSTSNATHQQGSAPVVRDLITVPITVYQPSSDTRSSDVATDVIASTTITNPTLTSEIADFIQSKLNTASNRDGAVVAGSDSSSTSLLTPTGQSSPSKAATKSSNEPIGTLSAQSRDEERRNRFKRKADRSRNKTINVLQSLTISSPDSAADGGHGQAQNDQQQTLLPAGSFIFNRLRRYPSVPNIDYWQKGVPVLIFGTKGSENGQFNWPRGVAFVPSTGDIVVCDSSNHRFQLFDRRGNFLKSVGDYGTEKGEFDSLAGVFVNRYGQFVVTDRYNHRLQIFDSNGKYVREFGLHGQSNGKMDSPWGVTVDNQGFIYVCDRDNNRIQTFQADGTFVGKFGSPGSQEGEFQHPAYIAVSRQNQLLMVTDCENHRVQVFDTDGNFQFLFGSEGCNEGQFKYPRGIAIDDQGFIIVADGGNNRIQIFYPDGRFLTMFGTWGLNEGQMKSAEGVAITDDGKIILADRENHRVQIF